MKLKEQVEKLEKRVEELEKKVKELEAKPSENHFHYDFGSGPYIAPYTTPAPAPVDPNVVPIQPTNPPWNPPPYQPWIPNQPWIVCGDPKFMGGCSVGCAANPTINVQSTADMSKCQKQ